MIEKIIERMFVFVRSMVHDYGLIICLFVISFLIIAKILFFIIKHILKKIARTSQKMNEAFEQNSDEDEQLRAVGKIMKIAWKEFVFGIPIVIALFVCYLISLSSLLAVTKKYVGTFDGTILLPWIQNLCLPDPYYILPIFSFFSKIVINIFIKKNQGLISKKSIIITLLFASLQFIIISVLPAGIALYFIILFVINSYIKICIGDKKNNN